MESPVPQSELATDSAPIRSWLGWLNEQLPLIVLFAIWIGSLFLPRNVAVFIGDLSATLVLATLAILTSCAVIFCRKDSTWAGLVLTVLLAASAGISGWNMIALYGSFELSPVLFLQWKWTAHPVFYFLVLLVIAFLLYRIQRGVITWKNAPTQVTTSVEPRSQEDRLSRLPAYSLIVGQESGPLVPTGMRMELMKHLVWFVLALGLLILFWQTSSYYAVSVIGSDKVGLRIHIFGVLIEEGGYFPPEGEKQHAGILFGGPLYVGCQVVFVLAVVYGGWNVVAAMMKCIPTKQLPG